MSLYDAAQLQRKAEREIRKDRRELVALSEIKDGNPSAQARFTKVSKRMKEHERDYEDFCRQTGLATQKERIRVQKYNRSVSMKVRWAERKRKDALNTALKSGTISLKVNTGHQNKHIKDSHGYINGRSYVYGDLSSMQKLVDEYHGTGELMFASDGTWKNKEVIEVDFDIGVNVDPETGEESATNRFTIHYARKGTHVVPAKRRT